MLGKNSASLQSQIFSAAAFTSASSSSFFCFFFLILSHAPISHLQNGLPEWNLYFINPINAQFCLDRILATARLYLYIIIDSHLGTTRCLKTMPIKLRHQTLDFTYSFPSGLLSMKSFCQVHYHTTGLD